MTGELEWSRGFLASWVPWSVAVHVAGRIGAGLTMPRMIEPLWISRVVPDLGRFVAANHDAVEPAGVRMPGAQA